MSSLITLQITDGRIIHGINYTVNTTTLPTSIPRLAAAMPGGAAYGVYHIHTPSGWQYIPASQIAAVLQTKSGAPT
jgi:allophanate hydrolase subunit 1